MLKKNKSGMAGQGLVEFALILPVVLLLTLGVIEFGRIIAIYNESYNATREALRYGIVHPTACDAIAGVARQSLTLLNPSAADVIIEMDNGKDPADGGQIVASCPIANPGDLVIQRGWRLRVRLETNVSAITPFMNTFIPPMPLAYSGARTIYNEAGVVQDPPPSSNLEGDVTYWGCQLVMTTVQTLEPTPIEVMNVIDMSGSMSDGWGGKGDTSNPRKIASAKSALVMFNNLLDTGFGDTTGLAAFPGEIKNVAKYQQTCNSSKSTQLYLGKLRSGLTANVSSVNNIINSLSASGYTPIADGVRRGRDALLAGHVSGKTPVLILATDGMANVRPGTSIADPINGRLTGFDGYNPVSPPCNAEAHNGAIYEALLTKDAGIIFVGIAIGDDFNTEALQSMATPGFFFHAASQAELEAAFQAIRDVATYTVIEEVPMAIERDGARARITLNDGQGHIFTTIADDAGHFAFYNIPNGTYTVSGNGVYNGTTYEVTTNGVGGAPTTVTINLQGDATQDVFLTVLVPVCVVP